MVNVAFWLPPSLLLQSAITLGGHEDPVSDLLVLLLKITSAPWRVAAACASVLKPDYTP